MNRILVQQNVLTDLIEPRHITLMGGCFAIQFGQSIVNKHTSSKIRLLRAYGDQGWVANLLFLFEEEYLQGVDTVVWLVANRDLSRPAFPTFNPYRNRHAPGQIADLESPEFWILEWTKL